MNDLLTITEEGQRILIIITAERFLASKNQIRLVIFEFGDIGHQLGSLALHILRKCGSIKGQQ